MNEETNERKKERKKRKFEIIDFFQSRGLEFIVSLKSLFFKVWELKSTSADEQQLGMRSFQTASKQNFPQNK